MDDRAYVEGAQELQAEEPENQLILNDDGPNSGALLLVEYLFTENNGDPLENLESSNSEDSQNLYLNVEAPDDGHILPGTGRRINCLLPSLCIADKDNIRNLVTSIVYQRYTLGIFLPTIGIEMEGDGTTARVPVGWVDEKNLTTVEQLVWIAIALI